MSIIPPRVDNPEPKERRFYVTADSSVHLALQKEAHARGTDLWTLGGTVLTAWLNAGCPDFKQESQSGADFAAFITSLEDEGSQHD